MAKKQENKSGKEQAGMDGLDTEDRKEKKQDKKNKKGQVPFLLELVYSSSILLTVILAIVVALLSFLSGAKWMDIFIRTAVTILSTGILLWIFSMFVSNGAKKTLEAVKQETYQAQRDSQPRQQIDPSAQSGNPEERK